MLIAEIAAALAAAYLVILMIVAANQRAFIYFPDRRRIAPETFGLAGVFEHVTQTSDGERLIAWYMPATPGKPTILYFHGNAGGLVTRAERFQEFAEAGFGLFMPSYRSYSGSTGEPSEAAIIADAALTWERLVAEGVDPKDIVLYGESLGSGVAVQLAAKHTPRALVLEAPYSSVVDIGAWRMPLLPVRLLMLDKFKSVRHIRAVHSPLLIIHGERDGIIPIRFGRKLFEAAREPKRFIAYPRGSHSDLYGYGAFADAVTFLSSQ